MKEETGKINLGMTSRQISDAYLKEMEFARLMVRAGRKSKPILAAAGITETEVTILNIIDHAPGITSHEIAYETATTKGAVAQIIKSLNKKGMLIRQREGRMIHLFVTEKAHEVVLKDRQESLEFRLRNRQYTDDISDEEFQSFLKVIEHMILLLREAE